MTSTFAPGAGTPAPAQSTTATRTATWARWCAPKREPRRSGSCRDRQPLSSSHDDGGASMRITRNSLETGAGPSDWFTGAVYLDTIATPSARSRLSAASVHFRPGDRVFFEPGEDHWHGAAPDRFMTHIAMQEVDEQGSPATWGDHVTDEEYNAA